MAKATPSSAPAAASPSMLPLEGVTVLDFSQFLAGPACALRLADLGAQVIKVERPDGGDLCRSLYVADQGFEGDSALFHTINRNKQSFAADLKDPDALARVRALVAKADVMIHNFRPGVMERLGLDYPSVTELNPRLVYASVTGYGHQGPWKDKPGQDLLVQSRSGFAWLSGDGGQGPVPAGVSVADLTAGAHLVQGILALLVRRGVTGQGGRIDVSLMESAFDLQFEQFTTFLNGGRIQPERSRVSGANVHAAAPYGIYKTADGYLALAMTPIDRLGELLGCPALGGFPKDSWFRARDRIKAILVEHLAGASTGHWLGLLEPHGIWCAEVLDWPELTRHEAFQALELTQEIEGAGGGRMLTTRCPFRVDGQILTSRQGAPPLGADTDAITQAHGLDQGAAP
ncbi:CaiB/BaiF CoA transferase family protein [Geminicoccus roseus]|uniref:CaiB/BaiF CoA transferase family protein n=1 Tax=Geminicoccus roseus TaxID=404900 RepID=UPI00042544C2|nr:CaiB/BaiF CoA-transferase family protein [Geminicoccus roseus]